MDETQWKRIMNNESANVISNQQANIVNVLKRRTTFIKYKPNCHSYSRLYYLVLSEDAIHYLGSRKKSKRLALIIKDIDEIRLGFNTAIWRKCIEKGKIKKDKANLAFSILYSHNHKSLDLLAETEDIRSQWVKGLEFLINRYQSHMRTNREITDKWIWNLFTQADFDQSGHLDRNEVLRLLHLLNIELSNDEVDLYFRQANIRSENTDELKHLDKEEFLLFYKYISQRPELLKIICQFNESNNEQMAATLSDYTVVHKIARATFQQSPRSDVHTLHLRKPKSAKNKTLSGNFRRRSSIVTPESASSHGVERKNFLTIEQLKDFLQKEQNMNALSIEDCARLIARFEPSIEGRQSEEIGVEGFRLLLLHDEFCIINPDKIHRVYHDMTRPITDYFIATSHNTYLDGNQVYGKSTAETYVYALKRGCRAVEMDCYDGEDGQPVVYHGYTLTTSIKLEEILIAVQSHAFETSPYPLFLNIENNCSYDQQGVIAQLLKDIFKEQLLTKPLSDDFQHLPSPEQLKEKVLVRTRAYSKPKPNANPKANRSSPEMHAQHSHDIHPDLASLVIYSQKTPFTSISQVLATQKCNHTISLKESTLNSLIEVEAPHHMDLITLTQRHIVRVYPDGIRQDSSNLHPLFYWVYGVQMVALNYQTNDESMSLQHGFFSDNGGCGYLLKPPCLLPHDEIFDPKEKCYSKGKRLHIHIISGQYLPKKRRIDDSDISDPFVKVCTYGIECDYTEHRTPTIRNNGLNPIWDYKMSTDIYCPDLCLVIFQVRDHDRTGSHLLGQACIPFNALQLGYRHVKLRAANGDYIHGTIFVHVSIDEF